MPKASKRAAKSIGTTAFSEKRVEAKDDFLLAGEAADPAVLSLLENVSDTQLEGGGSTRQFALIPLADES